MTFKTISVFLVACILFATGINAIHFGIPTVRSSEPITQYKVLSDHIARDGDGPVCPWNKQIELAELYQVLQFTAFNVTPNPNRWDPLAVYMDDDIINYNNLAQDQTIGKTNVINSFNGIGVDYQRIANAEPLVHFKAVTKNALLSTLVKEQRDLRSGFGLRLPFYQLLTFKAAPHGDPRKCIITSIFEFANAGATFESIPSIIGDKFLYMCVLMELFCGPHMPSFGAPHDTLPETYPSGKCYSFWHNKPDKAQNNEFLQDGTYDTSAKSAISLAFPLVTLLNSPEKAPYICPYLGA